MTAGRRLAALAAAAVVAATCATAPADRDALAAPAAPAVVANQPNTTSYNLCIKVSCGGSGIQKADEYAGIVFNRPSPNPLSSGFQEVCQGSSYARLAFWFAYVHGYSGFFETTVPGCGASGPGYGLAVFWLGGCAGGSFPSTCVVHTGNAYNDDDGQTRKFLCAKAGFPSYASCTTHMSTPRNSSDAISNRNQYLNVASLLAAAGFPTLFMGGDFNQTPTSSNPFYVFWLEADTGGPSPSPVPQPTHGSYKIDYIFALNRTRAAQADVRSTAYSDHRILTGYFT